MWSGGLFRRRRIEIDIKDCIEIVQVLRKCILQKNDEFYRPLWKRSPYFGERHRFLKKKIKELVKLYKMFYEKVAKFKREYERAYGRKYHSKT